MSQPRKISIVVPVYNEEETVDLLLNRLIASLSSIEESYEVIFIDDGSTDNTLKKLREHQQKSDFIKVVEFSRNFGHEAALTAGIDMADGDAVIPIDADLQDPPELIPEMIREWKKGYDVVLPQRAVRRGETFLKKKTAEWFYTLIAKISPVKIPKNTGNFRLLDQKVVRVIRGLHERSRFMKGVFSWPGFKTTTIHFERDPRAAGVTKFNFLRMWHYALDGIFSFSNLPLQVWSHVGVMVSLISFLYGVFLSIRVLILGQDIPGYAALMVALLFLGGVQLISLGVLGEYIGRIYDENKRRPIYVINKKYGFEPTPVAIQDTFPERKTA